MPSTISSSLKHVATLSDERSGISVTNNGFLRHPIKYTPCRTDVSSEHSTAPRQRAVHYKSSADVEMGDRLVTIDMGQKVGAAVPLSVGRELGPHLTMSPGPRPTSIPSGILIHPTVWPQYTDVTDRQTGQTTVR